MATKLTDISVDEISLVSKPANKKRFTILKHIFKAADVPLQAFESDDPDLDVTATDIQAEIAELNSQLDTQDSRRAEIDEVTGILQEKRQALEGKLFEIQNFVRRRGELAGELKELQEHPPEISKQEEYTMAGPKEVIAKALEPFLASPVAQQFTVMKSAAGADTDFIVKLDAAAAEGAAAFQRANLSLTRSQASAMFTKSEIGNVIYHLRNHALTRPGMSQEQVLKAMESQASDDLAGFAYGLLLSVGK